MSTRARSPLFSDGSHFDILVCLVLVLAIFVPYHQVANHRFVEFDDGIYAFQNIFIIDGLTWDSICWAFTNVDSANWHPLTWMSMLIDRELFNAHAGAYLLENVAWHALASCLCYLAFRRSTGSRLFGFLVAFVFALHPANVENVAWLSERKSLLNAVFWFAAIISYVDFIETRSRRAYGITIIAHLLGLLAKPMSVTLPCTLVLIQLLHQTYHPAPGQAPRDWRKEFANLVMPILPLLALSAYFSFVTVVAQAVAFPSTRYPIDQRLISMLRSYGQYLDMFFHPTQMAIFYPLFTSQLTLHKALTSIGALLALSAGAALLAKRKPQLAIGWCWFLGTMVPVSGLVQVGSQSHADRYLYIPMVGLSFLYPVLFESLGVLRRRGRQVLAGATIAVLGVSMIAATWIQVSYWKDGVSLFQHALQVTGDCVTSATNLAVAFQRSERYADLVAYADLKIAASTKDMNKARFSTYKSCALYSLERYEAAIAAAKQGIAWGDDSEQPCWFISLSNFELGRLPEAKEWLAKARAAHKPGSATMLASLSLDNQMKGLEHLLEQAKSTDPVQK